VNCKACNTRIPNGTGVCPHCGHGERASAFIDRPASDPNADSSSATLGPLSPSNLAPSSADDAPDEMELSLDEAVGMGKGKSPRRRRVRKAAALKTAPSKAKPASAKERKSVARSAAQSGATMALDAEHIRHLVCERPELLERGLVALADAKGRAVGVGYETETGEIDLLARDAEGDFVVVMISGPDAGPQIVSEILHRVGWVRKHVCDENSKVRGILLLEGMDEELGYAATAVADTIDFRTWRLQVSFEDLEV
jgi:hypothetical protein